jgi:hypothetical protein
MQNLGKEHGRWETPRGSVTTWVLPPNLLVTKADGYMDASLADRIVESGNAVVARYGSLLAFHDWQAITGYESAARVRLTTWGNEIRAKIQRVHVLVGSKLVKMGVTVASLVLGNMLMPYDDRARFEAKLRDAQSTGGSPR